jgi:hypothetical protein
MEIALQTEKTFFLSGGLGEGGEGAGCVFLRMCIPSLLVRFNLVNSLKIQMKRILKNSTGILVIIIEVQNWRNEIVKICLITFYKKKVQVAQQVHNTSRFISLPYKCTEHPCSMAHGKKNSLTKQWRQD